MYKEYEINLIYKFIGLLLFLLIITFIENVYILSLLFFTIFFLNKKNSPIIILLSSITFLFLVVKYFNQEISLVNIMLVIDYIVIFAFQIKKEELLMVKNTILNKKFMYKDLIDIYYDKINDDNYEKFDRFVINKKLEENDDLLEIRERIVNKSTNDVFDKQVINYVRFYKNRNDYNNKLGLNKETIIYLGIHFLILVIVMVI